MSPIRIGIFLLIGPAQKWHFMVKFMFSLIFEKTNLWIELTSIWYVNSPNHRPLHKRKFKVNIVQMQRFQTFANKNNY